VIPPASASKYKDYHHTCPLTIFLISSPRMLLIILEHARISLCQKCFPYSHSDLL
jgi:hypothetical protein